MKKEKRLVRPIIVEEMTSEKMTPVYREKRVYSDIPDGCVRAVVLKEFNGMTDFLVVGDIVDLPDRRFRSLQMRGLVKEYVGDKKPNKTR